MAPVVLSLLLGSILFASSLDVKSINRREWIQSSAAGLLFPGAASIMASTLVLPLANAANGGGRKTPYLTEEYYQPASTAPSAGRSFFPALTPPFKERATYRYALGRNAYAFEQLLTFFNVSATIRTNVVELETGRLWVHSPQYPTGEFCQLLEELDRPVQHIVLPCNALEHKAPMAAFCKRYPEAQVWIAPGQYGPFGSCGTSLADACKMGYRVDGILGDDNNPQPPWSKEFDMATLHVNLPENAGPVSEVAFCHRPTKTLITTDAVVYIPKQAPDIFSTYFDAPTMKQAPDFWPKTVLQAVFSPLRTDSSKGSYYPGFEALQERLIRAPILRAFSDARAPKQARDWVETIASKWEFDRILTSHFASPIAATPLDFLAAFGYLTDQQKASTVGGGLPKIACRDWQLLDGLNQVIANNKLGAPATYDYKKDCSQYE